MDRFDLILEEVGVIPLEPFINREAGITNNSSEFPNSSVLNDVSSLEVGEVVVSSGDGSHHVYNGGEQFIPIDDYYSHIKNNPRMLTREEWSQEMGSRSTKGFFDHLETLGGALGSMAADLGDLFNFDRTAKDFQALGSEGGAVAAEVVEGAVQSAIGDLGHLIRRSIPNVVGFAADKVGFNEFGDDLRYESYAQGHQRMVGHLRELNKAIDKAGDVPQEVRDSLQRRAQTLSIILDPTTLLGVAAAVPTGGGSLAPTLGKAGAKGAVKNTAKQGLKNALSKIPNKISPNGFLRNSNKTERATQASMVDSPTAFVMEAAGNALQKSAPRVEGAGRRVAEFVGDRPLTSAAIAGGTTFAATGDLGTAGLAALGGGAVVGNRFFGQLGDPNQLGRTLSSGGGALFKTGTAMKALSSQAATRGTAKQTMKMAEQLATQGQDLGVIYGNLSRWLGGPNAVKVWGGLSDNLARTVALDGAFGLLATGTTQGAAEEIGEGIILGNAAYYGTRGVSRLKNQFTTGAAVNLETSIEAKNGYKYLSRVFLNSIDDIHTKDNLKSIQDADPTSFRHVMNTMRHYNARGAVQGQVNRVIFADRERYRRILTAEQLGNLTNEDVIINEQTVSRYLESNEVDKNSQDFGGVQGGQIQRAYDALGEAADKSGKTLLDLADGHNKGLAENPNGDVVPTVIINQDKFIQRNSKGEITGIDRGQLMATLGHENDHTYESYSVAVTGKSRRDQQQADQFIEARQEVEEAALRTAGIIDEEGNFNEEAMREVYNALRNLEVEAGARDLQKFRPYDQLTREEKDGFARDYVQTELNGVAAGIYHQVISGTTNESVVAVSERLAKGGRQAKKVRENLSRFANENSQEGHLAHLDQEKAAFEMQGVAFDPLSGLPIDGDGKILLPKWGRAYQKKAGLDDGMLSALANYTVALDDAMSNPNLKISPDKGFEGEKRGGQTIVRKEKFDNAEFRERNPGFFSAKKHQDGTDKLRSNKELAEWGKKEIGEPIKQALDLYTEEAQGIDPDAGGVTLQNGFKLVPVQKGANPNQPDSYTGHYLTKRQLEYIEENSPTGFPIEKLRAYNDTLLRDYGKVQKIVYAKAIKSGTAKEYGSASLENKAVSPMGFYLTNQGHFNMRVFDVAQMMKDLRKEVTKGDKSDLVREVGSWQDQNAPREANITAALQQLMENRIRGEEGVGANKDFTPSQRDAMNKFLGFDTQQTAQGVGVANPNQFGSNVRGRGDRIVKEYRLERTLTMEPMNHPMSLPVNYWATKVNFSVEEGADGRAVEGDGLQIRESDFNEGSNPSPPSIDDTRFSVRLDRPFPEFSGKPQEAIDHLLDVKAGHVPSVWTREDIGPIDLIWGKTTDNKNKDYGLSKIEKYHPEMLPKLSSFIAEAPIVRQTENSIFLERGKEKAIIKRNFSGLEKQWVLTAYEEGVSPTDVSGSDPKESADTAP